MFGNEHSGVSEEIIAMADGNFIIPQVGIIKSLNISVACAVTLYEAYRQKNNAGHYDNIKLAGVRLEGPENRMGIYGGVVRQRRLNVDFFCINNFYPICLPTDGIFCFE